MAIYLFTKAILAGEPIRLFNHGDMRRDFTYIDDITRGVLRTLDRPPRPAQTGGEEDDRRPGVSVAPFRVYNIGNNKPVELNRVVELLEAELGRNAIRIGEPMQPGDVRETYADISALARDAGFRPDTPIEVGIRRFVEWYKEYHSNQHSTVAN